MEQLKDFRLNATPKILLAVCISLLVARIGLSIFEWSSPHERGLPVAWIDVESLQSVELAAVLSPNSNVQTTGTPPRQIKLYEFYADWCDPCKRMERDVMTNDEIRKTIESNFTALRVIDRQRELGKNTKLVSELQRKYRVFAFPTLVAVGPDDEPLGLLVGNSSSLAVYRFLSRVINDSKSPAKKAHIPFTKIARLLHGQSNETKALDAFSAVPAN